MHKSDLNTCFAIIENPDFNAQISGNGTIAVFQRLVEKSNVYRTLYSVVTGDLYAGEEILNRIKKLVNYVSKNDCIHEFDHAIAVYVYLLYKTHIAICEKAIMIIAEYKLNNLWWSAIISNEIASNLPDVKNSKDATPIVISPVVDVNPKILYTTNYLQIENNPFSDKSNTSISETDVSNIIYQQ